MASDARTTEQLGKRLVTAELRERGFDVRATTEGRRPYLLAVKDGSRHLVRVTAKRTGTWQTSIDYGAPEAGPEHEGLTWVFVDIAHQDPAFFVVPAGWMARDIHTTHQEYLRRNDGRRARTAASKHHAVTIQRISRWHDRWDVLTNPDETG